MRRPEFNKNWRVLDGEDDDRISVINVVTSRQLAIEAPKTESKFLFELLLQGFSQDQIVEKFCQQYSTLDKQWVIDYLKELERVGIVRQEEDIPLELTTQYLAGLDRQLDFLTELRNGRNKYENQLLVKNTKIAILGLGNIGQWIILSLVASGVGFFKCVDFDTVEERNIGRQPIFRKEDIDKPKCEVIARFITAHRHGVRVEPINIMLANEEDIEEVIQDCDVVLQCCDLPRFLIHRWINNACLRLKKPNLLAYSGRVGPFCIPYETACYGCLETKLRQDFVLYDSLIDNIGTSQEVERFPELACVGALTGTLATKEVIGHILGIKPQTYNVFLDINPFTLKIHSHKLPRDPQCYACKGG